MADDSTRRGADPLAALAGGGEMGRRVREFDWSGTPLGPVGGWPQALRSALGICLNSNFPIAIYWGADLVLLYNDEWSPIPGDKHPWALGRPAREAWPEIWHIIEPLFRRVMTTGEATRSRDQLLPMHRHGFTEECYFDYTFSPVRGDGGDVEGVFNAVLETTTRVIGERRLRTLRELGAWKTGQARTAGDACRTAAHVVAENPHDLPFALLYLLDGDRRATLAGQTGRGRDTAAGPAAVDLDSADAPWPFRRVAEAGKPVEVDDLPGRFGPLPGGAWPESPRRAVVLPLARPGQTDVAGFVVAGVSPRLTLDDDYRGFLDLLAGHVAAAVASARAYEEERRRAEALAELDRAKTAFFSNVSHEFRTPLTLMLGPVEDALADTESGLPPAQRERVEVVHRNGLRLQRLVNALLDFSRIEAGRARATYEPTDLAALTADLASTFRSACERAGLALAVDCPPVGEPVFVDRQMYETVVLNLLSNAFKFTLHGGIAVSLRRTGGSVELRVRDTGTGIPAAEMPRLFERFHRVENARGRTYEGSGIGLALVHELVKLHGGTIAAASEVGTGTTFAVTLPLGAGHLPAEQVGTGGTTSTTASSSGASPFVEEALRWLPDAQEPDDLGPALPDRPDDVSGAASRADAGRPRVLVADDNHDMRRYVQRLLAGPFTVEAVADGAAALEAVRRRPPDLVLSDVMMPRLDGFGLLKALRADPGTATIPVVLLSARAGEESRVEGVEAGADDYLVKPFSARELLARVTAQVQLARLRREAGETLRASEERFRTLFDSMDQGFCVIEVTPDAGRPADFRFVELNPAFERQSGLRGVLGRSVRDAVPGLEPFWFDTYARVAATGEPTRFVHRAAALDRWFEVYAFRLRGGGSRVAVLFADITERKVAEAERVRLLAELEAKTAFTQAVIRQLPVGILVAEAGTGRLLLSNDEAGRLGGVRYESGHPLSESDDRYPLRGFRPDGRRYAPDDWPLPRALCGEAVQGEEIELLRGDGSRLTIRVNAAPIRDPAGAVAAAVVAFHDVTAEKQAQARLRESEALYRTLGEAAPDLVRSCDRDGKADYVNRRWLEYTGLSTDRLNEVGWAAVNHPDDRAALAGRWAEAARRGGLFEAEFRYRRHDGVYRWFLVRAAPVRDEGGGIVRWVGTSTDIEDVKRLEAALRDADRRKDEFLATLAHELRNPLAPLRNGLQIMRLAGGERAAVETARTMMERQLGQMVRLVDDLLDLSRISRGKIELRKERVDLTGVVQQAVETSRPQIDANGHDLALDLPPQPLYVEADVTRLAQVYSNLLNNAARYTDRGGRIRLSVQHRGREAVVSVRDTGIGIPAHMLPHVFEMFTQVDRHLERSQGGLGIGLSIVKKLVEMHGGTVEARSNGPGTGSEFVVRLPVVLSVARPDGGDEEPVRPSSRRRVLVVDDNVDAAVSLAMMLTLMGSEARTAHDGLEALDVAAAYRPDVILLDIGMPRLNGYDTARRIRELPWGKGVVLVALTGWGQEEDRRKSREAGFDSHMTKPVEPAALEKLLAAPRAGTA